MEYDLTGVRFHPTEQEIVSYFIERKMCDPAWPSDTIQEVENVCKLEPRELIKYSKLPPDDQVWYFFNAPVYKRVGGKLMMERTTGVGSWKVTGKDREIWDKQGEHKIGFKRNLVFHSRRASNGINTNWVMHEYHSKNATHYPKEYILFRLKRKSRDKSRLASNPGSEVASAMQVNYDLSEEFGLHFENNALDHEVLAALLSMPQPEQGVSHCNGFVNECNPWNSHFNATEQDNAFVELQWAEQARLHATDLSEPLTGVFVGDSSDTDTELVYGQVEMLEIASSKEYGHKPMAPVFYETSSSSDSERYKAENGFFDEIVDSDTDMSENNCLELAIDEFPTNTRASKYQFTPKSHSFMVMKCDPQKLDLHNKALREAVSKVKAREAAMHAIDLPKQKTPL